MKDSDDDKTGDSENVRVDPDLPANAANLLDVLRPLRPRSSPEDINHAVRAWAAAIRERPKVERVTETVLARRLLQKHGISGSRTLLDAAIREADEKAGSRRTVEDSAGSARPNPAPWPNPVNAEKLLDRIEERFRRYVVVDEHAYPILTVWVALTYVFECFDVCPLLFLRSPVKRCGKTTLLDVLDCLVSKPLGTSNITAAGAFRAIDTEKPTLLIDEFDSAGSRNSELRNIINAGHRRSQARVIRAKSSHDVYCPKALAAIGDIPSTIVDRAFVIQMKRKGRNDSIKALNFSLLLAKTESVRQRLVRWSQDNGDALASATHEVPEEVKSDRARDNARPLLAIAATVGGRWPEHVSEAVVALSSMADQEVEADVAEVLLKDLARIFRLTEAERIETKVILRKLAAREASPWPTFSQGQPITREQLARLLRPFGVKPSKWAGKGHPRKFHRGYTLTDLRDAFVRYASWNPPHPPQGK